MIHLTICQLNMKKKHQSYFPKMNRTCRNHVSCTIISVYKLVINQNLLIFWIPLGGNTSRVYVFQQNFL